MLPPKFPRLFHVGRLDAQSEGLILLTNDGDFAQRLTHPRHQIEKEYEVVLDRLWDPALTPKLLRGIFLDGERAKILRLQQFGPASVRVVLRQGINRQIRRMFYDIGYDVKKLTRIRIGNLRLRDLPRGHWRALTRVEIDAFDSIQLGAQNRERRRVADTAAGGKPNRNRKERHGERGDEQRRKRRSVGKFKDKRRQRPTREDREHNSGRAGKGAEKKIFRAKNFPDLRARRAERAQKNALFQPLIASAPDRAREHDQSRADGEERHDANDERDFAQDRVDGLNDGGQIERGDIRKFRHDRVLQPRGIGRRRHATHEDVKVGAFSRTPAGKTTKKFV